MERRSPPRALCVKPRPREFDVSAVAGLGLSGCGCLTARAVSSNAGRQAKRCLLPPGPIARF